MVEAACVVGKTLAGTAIEIYDLDFQAYSDIVKRVQKDIKYSQYCYESMPYSFYDHPELDAWIRGTITGAEKALSEFKNSFPETPKDKEKPKVADRVKYTLLPVDDSARFEKALRCCHSSLLTGITVMNQHGLVPHSQVVKKAPRASGLPPSAMPRSSAVDSEF